MTGQILVKRPLRDIIARVKSRPRYRAQMLREAFLHEAGDYGGCTLKDVSWEFWARYGFHPTRNLLAQQATLLLRDKRLVKPRQGFYQRPPPAMPERAPAAHAPAESIFD